MTAPSKEAGELPAWAIEVARKVAAESMLTDDTVEQNERRWARALVEAAAHYQLQCGQQRARCAVFMQAMASFARTEPERARYWVQRADEAAANVRFEDFTTAKVSP